MWNGAFYQHWILHEKDFEIVICDDCSDKKTIELLSKLAGDERVTIYYSSTRLGTAKNWKKCIELARGRWVQFLSTDDYFSPGSVDAILENLSEKSDVLLVPMHCFNDKNSEF